MTLDDPTDVPQDLSTAEESLLDQTPATPAGDHATSPASTLPPELDELRESTPGSSGPQGAAGGMGVSSERVGHAGPGQTGTDGLNPTEPSEPSGGDLPAEQSTGSPEENPVGLPPKAGYPSRDPRSDERPFETRGPVSG